MGKVKAESMETTQEFRWLLAPKVVKYTSDGTDNDELRKLDDHHEFAFNVTYCRPETRDPHMFQHYGHNVKI